MSSSDLMLLTRAAHHPDPMVRLWAADWLGDLLAPRWTPQADDLMTAWLARCDLAPLWERVLFMTRDLATAHVLWSGIFSRPELLRPAHLRRLATEWLAGAPLTVAGHDLSGRLERAAA